MDLDAIARARRAAARGQERRRLPVLAGRRCASTSPSARRSRSSSAATRCAAWTTGACCSAATRPGRRSLPLIRIDGKARADALAEAARVAGSLPARSAAKVDYVEVRTVDTISLRLRNGRTVRWGSADESAAKARVLAVLLEQKAVDVRRQRPRPADHHRSSRPSAPLPPTSDACRDPGVTVVTVVGGVPAGGRPRPRRSEKVRETRDAPRVCGIAVRPIA